MARNEIDRIRARSALDVIKQHPGMALFLASPAIVAVALVWWLAGAGWAFLLFALVAAGTTYLVVRKR